MFIWQTGLEGGRNQIFARKLDILGRKNAVNYGQFRKNVQNYSHSHVIE